MRIRRWGFVPVLMVLAMVVMACGKDTKKESTSSTTGPATTRPTFAAGTTMANIQAKGKIVVGVKFNQLGSGLKNPTTGKLEGFDIEIAKLIAVGIFGGTVDNVESKIDFQETVSGVREFVIQNNQRDIVVATYTITAARKNFVDFAGPYVIDGQDIMVKADNTTIKTIADLNGKKVCTGQGSTTPDNLKAKNVTADITLLPGYPECAEGVRQGRYDAVVTDRGILLGINASNAGQYKLLNQNVSEEPLGIGLKKGDDTFRNWLNDRLQQIEASGEWAAAYARTLGKLGLATPTPPAPDRYASSGTATSVATTTTTVATTSTTVGSTTSTTK